MSASAGFRWLNTKTAGRAASRCSRPVTATFTPLIASRADSQRGDEKFDRGPPVPPDQAHHRPAGGERDEGGRAGQLLRPGARATTGS